MDDWREMTKEEKEMAVYLAVILHLKGNNVPIMTARSEYGPLTRDQKIHYFAQGVAAYLSGLKFFKGPPGQGHSIRCGPTRNG